jgi:AraC family transcriptional activator of tynA and feaB
MTLLDSATPFEIGIDGPFQQIVVAFPRALITSLSRGIEYRTALAHAGPGGPSLIADFVQAYAASAAHMPESERANANIAVAYLVDGLRNSDVEGRVGTLFGQAIRLIDSNIAGADAETIATQLGISRRYLDRIFSNAGRTFSEHLWERRLVLAANRLQGQSGTNVTEIAHSVGFKDSSHFARSFRKRFGVAPREWLAKGRYTR